MFPPSEQLLSCWGSIDHTHGSVWHSPSAACGTASRSCAWDRLSRHRMFQRWLCHVPQKAPSASVNLVAISCHKHSLTHLWGSPGPQVLSAELLPSLHPSMGLFQSRCRTWCLCLFNFEVSINLFLQVIKVLPNSSCALPVINLVSSASLRSLSIPPSRWLMKLLNSIGPNTDSQGQSQHSECLNSTATLWTKQRRFSPKLPTRMHQKPCLRLRLMTKLPSPHPWIQSFHHRRNEVGQAWSLPLENPQWMFPITFLSFKCLEMPFGRICSIPFPLRDWDKADQPAVAHSSYYSAELS